MENFFKYAFIGVNRANAVIKKVPDAGFSQEQKDLFLGEAYFLRAQEYFFRLRKLGDFPIITRSLPDDREVLIEASRRYPRNKVARFIIADLDSAANLLSDGSGIGGRARITRDVALLR